MLNDYDKKEFLRGARDAVPIGLCYLVVGFTLGIIAKKAGLAAWQGWITSFLNNASAGEYAAFTLMTNDAPYWELAVMTFIANARYLLMSCVISQKLSPNISIWHRIFVGFDLTDEIFGISAVRKFPLNPFYNYGAMAVALPAWSCGTALGVYAGNTFPDAIVSALAVSLYGMFLAIIIPPSKENKIIAGSVVLSFASSFLADYFFAEISSGTRTIFLTIIIACAVARLFPIKEENETEIEDENKNETEEKINS